MGCRGRVSGFGFRVSGFGLEFGPWPLGSGVGVRVGQAYRFRFRFSSESGLGVGQAVELWRACQVLGEGGGKKGGGSLSGVGVQGFCRRADRVLPRRW